MSDKFVFGSAGEIQEVEFALARANYNHAEVKKLSGGDFLGRVRQVLLGRAEVVTIKPRLLEPVATIKVGGAKKFVAADNFVVGKAVVAWLGENFKANFFSKVETCIQPAILRIHRLTEAALDEPIRAELGTDREETFLAQFFALLKKQFKEQTGPLLTNGYANIFYIRDAKGELWAAHARWYGGGWSVHADSVAGPNGWYAGGQVFSRD